MDKYKKSEEYLIVIRNKMVRTLGKLFGEQHEDIWANIVGVLSFFASYHIAVKVGQAELVWPFIILTASALGLRGVAKTFTDRRKEPTAKTKTEEEAPI